MRLAILASHPIQYQAPLFRELARLVDLEVYFCHRSNGGDQADAGFGIPFDWDIDLLSGYPHTFLNNVSRQPGLSNFSGCDTPTIGNNLTKFAPEALLVLGWHLKSFWQGIWAAKSRGIPVMVRGDSQLETPRSLMKRVGKSLTYPIGLRFFDAALYVGERSRRYWEHYHYPQDRLFSSPHCVDNRWFAQRATHSARMELRSRLGITDTEKVLLFAGKLIARKRPIDLVSATAKLHANGRQVIILVAGSGPLESEMSRAACSANVRIIQLGFTNQTAMPAAYSACDVLVLPSDASETWGLVANEALACGRPIVVSSACGCAPDLAADNRAGRTFSVGNPLALADAVAGVLDHPPTQQNIADKIAQYSIENAVTGIKQALDNISSPVRIAA
ncbi:MAG: hypothetical protein CTY31_02285 [Hyphomicrobium sp.]|nr:MAG: hypothetical protein CTY39_01070 [Hyphomicrobium sp.]PPD01604.1 MAG: hypothetical protein CTY31_02285 [Hyphomicrobium sp.]